MQGLGDEIFAYFRTIRIRGIDEIHAQIGQALQDAFRFVAIFGFAPDTVARDAHGAETEAMNRKISA
jgi:hypothetical protein